MHLLLLYHGKVTAVKSELKFGLHLITVDVKRHQRARVLLTGFKENKTCEHSEGCKTMS